MFACLPNGGTIVPVREVPSARDGQASAAPAEPHAANNLSTYVGQLVPFGNLSLCLDSNKGRLQLLPCQAGMNQMWTLGAETASLGGNCLLAPSADNAVPILVTCPLVRVAAGWRFTGTQLKWGESDTCLRVGNAETTQGDAVVFGSCLDDGVAARLQFRFPGSAGEAKSLNPNEAHRQVALVNRCNQDMFVNDGNYSFVLAAGTSNVSFLPFGWAGRIWGRTDCTILGVTATCSNDIALTLAEFKFDGWGGDNRTLDYYDLSLVDAFNVAMQITTLGGTGDCRAPLCGADLWTSCPQELRATDRAGKMIACLSGCIKYHEDAMCCQNQNSERSACPAPPTSLPFKAACPEAYSYPYDDATSMRSCASPAGYAVTFCP